MTTYAFASGSTLFILAEDLSEISRSDLSDHDILMIAEGQVSGAEKAAQKSHKDLVFCNAKHEEAVLTDMHILGDIVAKYAAKDLSLEYYHKIVSKKIKDSVTWDTLLCQAIRSIDEIDKSINLLAKRLREWYEWHNPEVSRSFTSHEVFAEKITSESSEELLKELGITQEESMGAEIPKKDMDAILALATQVLSLKALREQTTEFIHAEMKERLPQFTIVAGAQVGAKLLSLAGSAQRLMKMTASTIQVLGAEKALFRHIKTGARPPKYGILFQHQLVVKAKQADRGRIARKLSNALTIAIKADYFKSETPNLGATLLAKVEQ
ncbi:MAG TPA: hypothetical protein VK158_01155 [Acidobacteriota bacterium]|nr:hypothetical protein [Acidobacteriota bacterium]